MAVWLTMAPPEIGGQTTYIIVVGNSMEPLFHNNDLVLVHPSNIYKVNDIVAYKNPDLGIVFHRIRKIENNHYIFKGDNNSWEDSYHPVQKELIGKLWLHLKGFGKVLRVLRSPFGFSSFVIIFILLFFAAIYTDLDHTNKKVSHPKEDNLGNTISKIPEKDRGMDNKFSDSLYLIASIGFIAIILAIASFSMPLETSTNDSYPYTHQGHFEYFSSVPEDIYDNNMLQSGDPIYRQINDSFNVIFTYEIDADKPVTNVNGTYRMVAIIKEASGWERSVDLLQPSLINVSKFTSSATVNLSQIQSLIDNFEEQTGVTNNRFTLVIQPEIAITCKINGKKVQDSFLPQLRFSFDDQKLVLLQDNDKSVDVLNPTKENFASVILHTPNSISILGLQLNILVARLLSIFTLLGTVIATGIVLYKNGYFVKSKKKEK